MGKRSKDLDNVYAVRKLIKDRLIVGHVKFSIQWNILMGANYPKRSKNYIKILLNCCKLKLENLKKIYDTHDNKINLSVFVFSPEIIL